MGQEYFCSWTLDGEAFTLKNHDDVFSGTLRNGIITVDFSDMVFTYQMDPAQTEDSTVQGHVHQWKEADCINSALCTDCGETQGEPLGHSSTEANYQDPAVCTVCGEITGEVLQPDMEHHGITEFMEVGGLYPYKTHLINAPDLSVVGQVEVESYEVFESAEGYPAKEGYEWRVLTLRPSFSGYEVYRYAVKLTSNIEDYYNILLLDDTHTYDEETNRDVYQINYHGELMEVTCSINTSWNKWTWKNGQRWVDGVHTAAYCVPAGYDGIVYGLRDSAIVWEDGMHLGDVYTPEDFLLFRLA